MKLLDSELAETKSSLHKYCWVETTNHSINPWKLATVGEILNKDTAAGPASQGAETTGTEPGSLLLSGVTKLSIEPIRFLLRPQDSKAINFSLELPSPFCSVYTGSRESGRPCLVISPFSHMKLLDPASAETRTSLIGNRVRPEQQVEVNYDHDN